MRDCIAADYFGTRALYGQGARTPVYQQITDACEGAGYLDNDKLESIILAAAGRTARRCPSDYVYCESRCLQCATCGDELNAEFNGWCKRRLEKWSLLYRDAVQPCALSLCSAPCDYDRWDYISLFLGVAAVINIFLIISTVFKKKKMAARPKVQSAVDAYETYRNRHDLDTEEDIAEWNRKLNGQGPDFYHATQIAEDDTALDDQAAYENRNRNEMAIVEDFRSGVLEVCYPVNA